MPDVTFKADDGSRLPCREGEARTEYREESSGLRLRVSSTGARTWAVAYWSPLAKTTRRLKLGNASTMPLSKARAAARAALHAVEQEGKDPQADRAADRLRERQQRAERAAERRRQTEERKRHRTTFGDVCRTYVEERRTRPSGKYSRPAARNTLHAWSGILENYVLPGIGGRHPQDLTSEDFLQVLDAAVTRGGASMGPRTREFLSAVWRWMQTRRRALGVELPAVSPLLELPKVGVAKKERDRVLTPAEVWRFWRAAGDEGLEGEALRLSLLTAARVREATELPWSEVDLDGAAWRLPAARNKSARDRAIPLSRPAVELLRRVRDGKADRSALVFGAGATDRLHLGAMSRLRVAVGGEPIQARDLRRTAATLCARLGADPFLVAVVLGHAKPDQRMPGVTGAYLRWDYADRAREILDRVGEWVEATVSRAKEPGDVVRLEAR